MPRSPGRILVCACIICYYSEILTSCIITCGPPSCSIVSLAFSQDQDINSSFLLLLILHYDLPGRQSPLFGRYSFLSTIIIIYLFIYLLLIYPPVKDVIYILIHTNQIDVSRVTFFLSRLHNSRHFLKWVHSLVFAKHDLIIANYKLKFLFLLYENIKTN